MEVDENETRKVVIPLKINSGEAIEVFYNSLPPGPDGLNILRSEHPILTKWIDLGLAYYRMGFFDEFAAILEVSGVEADLRYEGVETDQMLALDILAAYMVVRGASERHDKEIRKHFFARATLLYTTADRVQMYDQNHLAGRAYFCLIEGKGLKLDQAAQQFNFVLKQNPNSIPAMMGMACINFNKKEYKTALYYYKKCLKQKPDGPADFRVGIGMCLVRLGQLDKARTAFERALEVDEECVSALVSLAVLDENEHTTDCLKQSIFRLGLAYKLESDNPVVLVNLANHLFYKKDLERVDSFATHALNIADSDTIKSEACFQLARCYHVQGDFERAFKYYYQATTLNLNSILPYYGLGQLQIQRGEYSQARSAFEHILKSNPNCTDSMKALGALYANSEDPRNPVSDHFFFSLQIQEHKQKAKEQFVKYLQVFPEDTEVLVDLAQLLEHSDPAKSLSLYEKSVELLTASGEDVSAEIINNIGSLYLNQNKYEEAKDMYRMAEQRVTEMMSEGNYSDADVLVTVRYNMGRCMEHLCAFEEAEHLYKEILKDQPNYMDAMCRLGCLARDRGQIYDASMLFKEAISLDPNCPNPWTLIGLLHMQKHEFGPAQKKFEHLLKDKDKNVPNVAARKDAYSHVALGNIWLDGLFNPVRDRANDGKYIDRALMMYTRALKIQSRNMWAANGIGCVLAHKKKWQEARDVFSQVREATSEFFDVWMNIANVYIETRQFVPAIQMYTNAIRKFHKENDPNVLASLARAYYASNKMAECRETMEKAIQEAPDNVLLKFNYAYVLKKISKRVLEDRKATSTMVNGAISDLKTAERIYSFINANRDETLRSVKLVSRTRSGEQARQCHDLLKQAQTYLSRAEEQDRIENEMRRKQDSERAALLERLQRQKEEKDLSEKAKMEEAINLRKAFVEMTKDCLKLPEIKEDEKKARGGGGGGGRRKKGGEGDEFVNDSSDMGDWQGGEGEEGAPAERRKKDKSAKKTSRKRREKMEFVGSGTDDEAERKQKKKKKMDKKEDVKLSAKQSAKIKSRAFLSSEDDSSDGAPPPPPDGGEDSPPPAIQTSDSEEEGSSKPRKLKPKVDSSDSGSDRPVIGADSDDDEPAASKGKVSSDSEDDTPKKRPKKMASSEESESD